MPDMMPIPDALYRALMHGAEEAFLILDQYTIQEGNACAARLLGVEPEQLLKRSIGSLCLPTQANGVNSMQMWQSFEQEARNGEFPSFEWQFQHVDGHVLQTRVKLRYWQQNGLARFLVLIQDMGEEGAQDASESALLTAKVKFQALLDNFPGGVSMIDQSLRFVAWNKEVMRLTGFTDDFFAPGTQPSMSEMFRYNIARGEYGELPEGKSIDQVVEEKMAQVRRFEPHHFIRARPDGLVLEVRGVPIASGGFVTTYQDITQQHNMKEQMRQQSALLREVLEHMAAGVMVFDGSLRLKAWNSNVIDMLDLPPARFQADQAYPDLWRTVLQQDECSHCTATELEQRLEAHIAAMRETFEHRYERTSSKGRTFLVHGKTLFDEGKSIEFIITMTEITDRKQAEMAQTEANLRLEKLVTELNEARADLVRNEKLAGLGSLVAGVAHELNTPLGNCLMMTSTIADSTRQFAKKAQSMMVARNELEEYFANTINAMGLLTQNLSVAADLIMRFKQVAITQAHSQRREFDFLDLVHDIETVIHDKIQSSGHSLTFSIEAGIVFDSYPDPLEQVMLTFIHNALQHAFEDGFAGTMTLAAQKINPQHVQLEFRDNGKGIQAQYLAHIFDPFFTINVQRGFGGLGLHICHNIVTSLLGGEIEAQSELGAGTVFVLRLPLYTPITY
jgi:signal transduction histidine kinase